MSNDILLLLDLDDMMGMLADMIVCSYEVRGGSGRQRTRLNSLVSWYRDDGSGFHG